MVTIVDYKNHENQKGEIFFALIVESELEIIKSTETGQFYATAIQASIPSTFSDVGCKQLLGQKLPGRIDRIPCEPYDYQVPGTTEMIRLEATFRYNPTPNNVEEDIFVEVPVEAR